MDMNDFMRNGMKAFPIWEFVFYNEDMDIIYIWKFPDSTLDRQRNRIQLQRNLTLGSYESFRYDVYIQAQAGAPDRADKNPCQSISNVENYIYTKLELTRSLHLRM